MNTCFIILAGGESKRFNSKIPKPYHLYKGKPLVFHSIDKVKEHKSINKIVLVINKKHKKFIKILKTKNIKIVQGGKTRSESAFKGLKSIKNSKFKNVMIHDAARPNFSLKLLNNLIKGLKKNNCVIPMIKSTDSIKQKNKNKIINLKKENIFLAQTPQAFRFKELFKLQSNKNSKVTDDSSIFINANKKIKIIKGNTTNYKITNYSDLKENNSIRYGIGFDIHRLVPKRKLFLGGINIPSLVGTLGHSDGDPVLHALIDSILGACGMGDIGNKFSDKNRKYKNVRSTILLKNVIDLIKSKNFSINNIDINIIAQKPKIRKYSKRIKQTLSKLCRINSDKINIKGKTTEKLGLIGKGKAIATEVIISVIKYD